MEPHWISGKEKVAGAAARKGGHTDTLQGHKRSIKVDILENGTTLNKAFISQS